MVVIALGNHSSSRSSRHRKSPQSVVSRNLLMGHVRILKRGEPRIPGDENKCDNTMRSQLTDNTPMKRLAHLESQRDENLSPESRWIIDVNLSGWGSISSPAPSSVPYHGFLTRQCSP